MGPNRIPPRFWKLDLGKSRASWCSISVLGDEVGCETNKKQTRRMSFLRLYQTQYKGQQDQIGALLKIQDTSGQVNH